LFGFPAQVNTVTAEKLHTCTESYIYIAFGHWGVQAASYIDHIRPLKVKTVV
jgi:hypothetical protein